jgi:hypothetical protein
MTTKVGPTNSIEDSMSLVEKDVSHAFASIVYLACPYTHPNSETRLSRFNFATLAAATLIRRGHIVYSPITMTHPIDVVMAGDAGTLGSDYWVRFDEAFMNICSRIVVLALEGWQESRGVKREIEHFRKQGKPISFMSTVDGAESASLPQI